MVAGLHGGDHAQVGLARQPDQRRSDTARRPSDDDGLSCASADAAVQADVRGRGRVECGGDFCGDRAVWQRVEPV